MHEFKWKVRVKGSVVQWFYSGGRRYDPVPMPPKRFEIEDKPDTDVWAVVAAWEFLLTDPNDGGFPRTQA